MLIVGYFRHAGSEKVDVEIPLVEEHVFFLSFSFQFLLI